MKFDFKKVEIELNTLDNNKVKNYIDYWNTITPITHNEVYNRWIFSFLSVHTSWKANVKGYLLLKNKPWNTVDELENLIKLSGVGLTKVRTKGIFKFTNDFLNSPDLWYKQENESWIECKNRLSENCFGIGYAKTAFALEMMYPLLCETVCLDRHILNLYGTSIKVKPSINTYRSIEQHWINTAKNLNIPSAILRNMYWDKIQNKDFSTYWSYVFEL